jgi:outer membrane protein TolC
VIGNLQVTIHDNSPQAKKRPSRLVSLLFGVALASMPAVLAAQISLGTVVDQAQRNSSAVRLADADLHKAYAVLTQTQDVYIPDFVIGSSIGPPSIGFPVAQPSIASATMQSLAFSVSQGQYIKAAQSGIRAASLSVKDAREQVALEASVDYIELDAVNRELDAGRQQTVFAERLVSIEQQRTDAGVDPLSELLQARLTAAQLKLKRLHLEARAGVLVSQLATLTALPKASIQTDHASIPEIPAIKADQEAVLTSGIESAQAQARSREIQAHGDEMATKIRPLIAFGAQYNRDATSLNNYNLYFSRLNSKGVPEKLKADNFSAGFSIQIPLFDMSRKAKARETAAEALRAAAEAEQAQRQNEVQIATLTVNLRELDAVAEIASLKQQISKEQLKTVEAQLETGNGSGSEPGATPQLTPKSEQLARLDQVQKSIDALDAAFDLEKARLTLLRALGHIDDWLREVQVQAPATASH